MQYSVENSIQITEELLPQTSRRSSKNISYVSLIRKTIDLSFLINFFNLETIQQKFYKNEQNIILSNRLMNWHDLIAPLLGRVELDSHLLQDKLLYINQMGIQSIIDTRGILFNRSQYHPESPSGISIHHFIHQLKLQLAQLSGEKRKLFEDSWR